MTDPYETLGVPKDASKETIRRAYRRRAAKAHPDREGGSDAEMTNLNKAYALLTDDSARAHFDGTGEEQPPEQPLEADAGRTLVDFFNQALDNLQFAEQDLISVLAQRIRVERQGVLAQVANLRATMRRDAKRAKRLKYRQKRTAHDFLGFVLKQRESNQKAAIEQGERLLQVLDKAAELLGDFHWEIPEEEMQRSPSGFLTLGI